MEIDGYEIEVGGKGWKVGSIEVDIGKRELEVGREELEIGGKGWKVGGIEVERKGFEGCWEELKFGGKVVDVCGKGGLGQ